MLTTNFHPTGRHFLQIPGPSPVPDRILRAISSPTIDHRGPEFGALGLKVLADVQKIFKTRHPVMIYPTSPAPAPLLASSLAEQNKVRERTMGVTAIAGFCGLPEVSIPAGKVDGAPVGLSLVGAPGRDRAVLAAAQALAASLGIGG